MTFKTYVPNHRVTLHRVANGRAKEDISADVVHINTHKRYGEAGTFTLNTTFNRKSNKQRYDQYIKPGDMMLIELDAGDGNGLVPVMRGLVNTVERHMASNNDGTVSRTVNISGHDFCGLMAQHHCMWQGAIRKDNEMAFDVAVKTIYGADLYRGGTPAEIIKLVVEKEMHAEMPWIKDWLKVPSVVEDPWVHNLVTISWQDTVWSFLSNVANKPYNTLHGDTEDDGVFYVYIEVCPFSTTTGKLELTDDLWHKIDLSDVISEQLGLNDSDRITYMFHQVYAGLFNAPGNGTMLYIKGENIREAETKDKENYGFRPWVTQTNFVPFNETDVPPQIANKGSESLSEVGTRTEALWNWNRNNHALESGIIELHGRPQIRSGEGVIYNDNGFEYFVEQLTHNYQNAGQMPVFRSLLHLTRGQKHAA